MARPKKITQETIKETFQETPKVHGWTKSARILKSLHNPYNLSGKVGDVREIPNHLYDELLGLKKIAKI